MSRIFILLIIVLALASSGCIVQFENPPETAQPAAAPTPAFTVPEPSTVYVEIRGSEFRPLELKVVNGTTVRWTNLDSGQHAIVVENVSSPPFEKRGSWAHTFNKTGTFEYNCSVHPWMKHGRIIVG